MILNILHKKIHKYVNLLHNIIFFLSVPFEPIMSRIHTQMMNNNFSPLNNIKKAKRPPHGLNSPSNEIPSSKKKKKGNQGLHLHGNNNIESNSQKNHHKQYHSHHVDSSTKMNKSKKNQKNNNQQMNLLVQNHLIPPTTTTMFQTPERPSNTLTNVDQLVMGNPTATYALLQQLKKMMEEKKQLTDEMQKFKATMSQPKRNKQIRKSRKVTTHFDFICKRIARKRIFRLVKFISSPKQLECYEEKGTIGYQFISELKQEDQVNRSLLIDGNEKEIWDNAKQLVHEAIGEKRNARQTQIKKAWKGWLHHSEY